MGDMTPLVVHHHFFKNAGISIDLSLKKYFGDCWISLEGDHARDIVTEIFFWKLVQVNPSVLAVSFHTLRPIKGMQNVPPIVFIRHPILRAKSVFAFTQKAPSQPNYQEI